MDELGSRQLQALSSIDRLLERAGIAYWLFGGWAVDFYVGSITRTHDDVDIAVWLEDLPTIHQILKENGWRHAPTEDADGGTSYEQRAVQLGLTYLVRDDDGDVFIPFNRGRVPWSADLFGNDARELLGVRARLVSLAPLMLGKSFPRDGPQDAAKDRADFTVLSSLTGEPTPSAFDSTSKKGGRSPN
jgi:hypothetical protein